MNNGGNQSEGKAQEAKWPRTKPSRSIFVNFTSRSGGFVRLPSESWSDFTAVAGNQTV